MSVCGSRAVTALFRARTQEQTKVQANKQERESSCVHRVLPCPTIEAHVCRWWSPRSCSGQRGGTRGICTVPTSTAAAQGCPVTTVRDEVGTSNRGMRQSCAFFTPNCFECLPP